MLLLCGYFKTLIWYISCLAGNHQCFNLNHMEIKWEESKKTQKKNLFLLPIGKFTFLSTVFGNFKIHKTFCFESLLLFYLYGKCYATEILPQIKQTLTALFYT